MVKRIGNTLFLVLTCALLARCQDQDMNMEPSQPEQDAQSEAYKLVWSDEFENEGPPDPQNWTYETGFVRNEELQWYQPENAFCKDGLLIIEARRDTFPSPAYRPEVNDWRTNREHVHFTSASITTKHRHTWRYGRFEFRARIKTEEGLWPAIWTLGTHEPWPEGGEIDIMEYYRGMILANAAWADKQQWQAIWDDSRTPVSSFNDPDWSEKFHIWRMDWTETKIELFLDEQLLNTIELSKTINQRGIIRNPFHTQHYLLINLALGGTNGGSTDQTKFPSRFEVDYVRVYQK